MVRLAFLAAARIAAVLFLRTPERLRPVRVRVGLRLQRAGGERHPSPGSRRTAVAECSVRS